MEKNNNGSNSNNQPLHIIGESAEYPSARIKPDVTQIPPKPKQK